MDIHGAEWTTSIKNGSRPDVEQRIRFGTAEFNRRRMQLSIDGKVIEIQLKPLEILSLLLAHSGSIVTRQMLFDAVWQGRPTVDNVLANAVSKLRVALGPLNAAYLITHPRIGYSLDCQVEVISSESAKDKTKTPLTVIDNCSREQPLKSLPQFTPLRVHNYLEGQIFFEGALQTPEILSMSGNFKLPEEAHINAVKNTSDSNIEFVLAIESRAHTALGQSATEFNGEKNATEAVSHNEEMDSRSVHLEREYKKHIPKSMRKLTTRLFAPSDASNEQRLRSWQVAALLFFLVAISEYFLILTRYFY